VNLSRDIKGCGMIEVVAFIFAIAILGFVVYVANDIVRV